MNTIKTYLPILFLVVSFSAYCQYTDVINSNRPGASQSAFAVGPNVIQLELGPNYVKQEHTPLKYEVKGFSVDFAAHYGLLFEPLEISVIGSYQNDTFTDNRSAISEPVHRSNFRNLTIGAKYLVYDPYRKAEEDKPNLYSWKANHSFKWKYLIPAVAVYAGANFDTKNNPYTAADVEGFSPKIAVISQNNFSGGWVFVVNLVKDRIGTDQSDFQYILTLTHSFNPKWSLFAETQGIQSDFYADNLVRFGGAYLFGKDFQLDAALTFNTKDTPAVFNLGIGASYRFDFHKDTIIEDDGTSAKDEGKRKERAKKSKKDVDFDDASGGDGQ
ncbi:MAG: transporter [Gelidibacter sp.]